MKKYYNGRFAIMVCIVVLLFNVIAGLGLHYSSNYIEELLLRANQNDAVDVATIVENNFSVTDAEVAYMKSLTFNEMETDPVNRRLMDTVSGLKLNDRISNIYALVLLPDDEVKYTVDEGNAEALGFEAGTRLNGIWLLNGKFDETGNFQPAEREDIFRYTQFCESDRKIFQNQKSFGLVTDDVWGRFITGYVPLYSAEGSYVGILGVDMDMNLYNDSVAETTTTLFAVYIAIILALVILSLVVFAKYMSAKDGALYYEFYSRLSHDLRTPMNGILGIADLSKGENDPAALHEDISKMENSGKYLLALINDTLDFQKMHSKKLILHKEIIDVRDHFKDIVNMVEATAEQKGIHFETNLLSSEIDGYILVDAVRLKQIFVNLLTNAIKFTPAGGTVRWLFEKTSCEGNVEHCVLTVQDTGIGMSEKFLKHEIFKPFSQEYNSTTAQYSGSGLGLSIVRSLVGQMGGRIEVESTQGEGTAFRVYLDFEKVDEAEAKKSLHPHAAKEADAYAALKGASILLAEDHPLNAEIAKKLLERQGCTVTWAEDGEKAVDAFAQSAVNKYDAILMDIRMPRMDGLEAARQIRALDREDAKEIPIIALTANAYDEDQRKSHDAGMNAHISKPIEPLMLYHTLATCLHDKD